jgi:hypothetical protein
MKQQNQTVSIMFDVYIYYFTYNGTTHTLNSNMKYTFKHLHKPLNVFCKPKSKETHSDYTLHTYIHRVLC